MAFLTEHLYSYRLFKAYTNNVTCKFNIVPECLLVSLEGDEEDGERLQPR